MGFSFKRLFSTFISDYENTHDEEGTLVLWSNWGRDQINILENLIVNDFTPPATELKWWIIVLIVLLVILLIVILWPILPYVIQGIVWIICLPYKLVKWIVKSIKKE